jgi:hypothetical protein
MTPALWVLLLVQLIIVVSAAVLCFLPVESPRASRRLVLGNTVALVLSFAASGLTILSGFGESFAADGPASEKAAQLASGLTTIMNGFILAVPFAAISGALLVLQCMRRSREPARSALDRSRATY